MTHNRNSRTMIWTTATLALLLAVGCKSNSSSTTASSEKPEKIHGEIFADDNAPTSIGLMTQAQAANGARADAMLYDRHFEGNTLNSLGTTKLDLIRKATPVGQPIVVYLNVSKDNADARQGAVLAFYKAEDVDESLIKVAQGSNPNNTTPTAYNLPGIYKGSGNAYDGTAADLQSSGGGGAPAAH
jgi:hypothetical protein